MSGGRTGTRAARGGFPVPRSPAYLTKSRLRTRICSL